MLIEWFTGPLDDYEKSKAETSDFKLHKKFQNICVSFPHLLWVCQVTTR